MTSAEIAAATYSALLLRRRELVGGYASTDRRSPSEELREINRRLVQIEQARIAEQTDD